MVRSTSIPNAFYSANASNNQTAADLINNFSSRSANARRGAISGYGGGSGAVSQDDLRNEILRQSGVTQDQLNPQMQSQLEQIMGMTSTGQTGEFGTMLKGFRQTAPAAIAQQQAQEQAQQQYQPYEQAGLGALEQQQALLGLSGQDAMNKAYNENPAQAFARQQQEKALLRNSAATGGLRGSGVQRELAELTSGLTNQNIQNQLSQLGALSGRGQQASGNIANSYGQMGDIQAGQIYDMHGINQAGQQERSRQNAADSARKMGMVSQAIGLGANVFAPGSSLLSGFGGSQSGQESLYRGQN